MTTLSRIVGPVWSSDFKLERFWVSHICELAENLLMCRGQPVSRLNKMMQRMICGFLSFFLSFYLFFFLRLYDLRFWGQNHYPFAETETGAQRNENNCLWPYRFELAPWWVYLWCCLFVYLLVYLSVLHFSLVHHSLFFSLIGQFS